MIWIIVCIFTAVAFAQLGALSVWVTVLSFALKAGAVVGIIAALATGIWWIRARRRA